MTLALEAFASERFEPESDGGACGESNRSAACNAAKERALADENYFEGRMHASVALAEASADSTARLVHFELAGRYSVAALAAGRERSLDRCRQ